MTILQKEHRYLNGKYAAFQQLGINETNPYLAPSLIAAGGSLPFLGYVRPRRTASPYSGKGLSLPSEKNITALAEKALPGDVILTSAPVKDLTTRAQNLASESPYTHTETVTMRTQGEGLTRGTFSEKPQKFKRALGDFENIALLRPRQKINPEILNNETLNEMRKPYDAIKGIRSGIKDFFIPKIPGVTDRCFTTSKGMVCSTIPAEGLAKATGKRTTIKGVAPQSTIPSHFLHGDFDLVGHISPGTLVERKAAARLMKLKGLGLRTAVGLPLAGLGYLTAKTPETSAAIAAGTAGGIGIPLAVRQLLGEHHKQKLRPLSLGLRLLKEPGEKAKAIRSNILKRTLPLTLASIAAPALATYLSAHALRQD